MEQFESLAIGPMGPGQPEGINPAQLPRPVGEAAQAAMVPQQHFEPGSCSADNMRMTVNAIPSSTSLRSRCGAGQGSGCPCMSLGVAVAGGSAGGEAAFALDRVAYVPLAGWPGPCSIYCSTGLFDLHLGDPGVLGSGVWMGQNWALFDTQLASVQAKALLGPSLAASHSPLLAVVHHALACAVLRVTDAVRHVGGCARAVRLQVGPAAGCHCAPHGGRSIRADGACGQPGECGDRAVPAVQNLHEPVCAVARRGAQVSCGGGTGRCWLG